MVAWEYLRFASSPSPRFILALKPPTEPSPNSFDTFVYGRDSFYKLYIDIFYRSSFYLQTNSFGGKRIMPDFLYNQANAHVRWSHSIVPLGHTRPTKQRTRLTNIAKTAMVRLCVWSPICSFASCIPEIWARTMLLRNTHIVPVYDCGMPSHVPHLGRRHAAIIKRTQ